MAPINLCTPNITDGEIVHQRCLLVAGTCAPRSDAEESISVKTTSGDGIETFPEQTWPIAGCNFKALVMLSPGPNTLEFSRLHNEEIESARLNVIYIPLLQYPPLHLAIMVAKDSPLLIDCPPHKRGGYSSTHSDLNAAVAKLRMTAYMWQAMTAEDMRLKGLGRRTFRLEEEWTVDTVSRDFLSAAYDDSLDYEGAMRATAKIHIIQSSKTTKEIRDVNIAQRNTSAHRENYLHKYFADALMEAGGPFTSSAHPIVAGLILDSHYSLSHKLILGHTALGHHNAEGISLGIFGSHLTYSWPRFLEEVTSCLTDMKGTGDKVGSGSRDHCTMWEACTISQGAFLQEVGHAFGSPHRSKIMQRGYARDWAINFLSDADDSSPNTARWNLSDALSFRVLPHFRQPADKPVAPQYRKASPKIDVEYEGDEELNSILCISSPIGIARVIFDEEEEEKPSIAEPVSKLRFTQGDLEKRFSRAEILPLKVLGFNGKESTVPNVWEMLTIKTFVRIPGSNVRLFKRSIYSDDFENRRDDRVYEWAQLLKEKGPDGSLYRVASIDLRVGCLWDGGVVKYTDGHASHWGPMRHGGSNHSFGGHASEEIDIPEGINIKRIDINRGQEGSYVMDGIRMHLTNRTSRGELNRRRGCSLAKLEPTAHEVIVGFYGKNERDGFCGVIEFGIITAPKNVGLDGLPDETFDLPELRNTAGIGNDDDSDRSDSEGTSDDYHGDDADSDSGSQFDGESNAEGEQVRVLV